MGYQAIGFAVDIAIGLYQIRQPESQTVDQYGVALWLRHCYCLDKIERGLDGSPRRSASVPMPVDPHPHLGIARLGGGNIGAVPGSKNKIFGKQALARPCTTQNQRNRRQGCLFRRMY